MTELESPETPEELYRYRGQDVPRARPILQGDVFEDVEIPGLDDGPGLAMVVTHACSMREGPKLRARLLMGRVSERSQPIPLPWTGNFRYLPLPDLIPGRSGHWVLTFEDMGPVRTETLDLHRRIACLDDRGVLLLQQRQAHHFTRTMVETPVLYEATGSVLAEVELLEAWREAALRNGSDDAWEQRAAAADAAFDAFISSHRDDLKDPTRWAPLRRAVHQEIGRRFA